MVIQIFCELINGVPGFSKVLNDKVLYTFNSLYKIFNRKVFVNFPSFYRLLLYYICVSVGVHNATGHLCKLVLSFSHVAFRSWTQVVRFGDGSMSRLPGPWNTPSKSLSEYLCLNIFSKRFWLIIFSTKIHFELIFRYYQSKVGIKTSFCIQTFNCFKYHLL